MVSVDVIKSAIVDREEDMRGRIEQGDIIERECINEVRGIAAMDMALIITGVRRCGKSFLAWMLASNKNVGYVNFEDERLNVKGEELNKILEAVYSLKGQVKTLIFDEIQNVEGWERFVSRLILGRRIIITGSNARLLSSELATYMTGRHINFVLYPFSFREFLRYQRFNGNIYSTENQAKIKDYLKEYMEIGGFPLAYTAGNIFLAENYRDIIERDIMQRYGVKYPASLRDLGRYTMTNVSREISFNCLKNILGIKSPHTVRKYMSYLENAYLAFLIERFSYKLKEQVLAPKKVYAIDTGLANAVGFKTSQNYGRAMENLVAIELLRRRNYWNRGWEIYYWKDYQQREVDFVVKEGARIVECIQVTYASGKDEIEKREIKALDKASEELRCKNKIVITWDYEEEGEIRYIPLWKWILGVE